MYNQEYINKYFSVLDQHSIISITNLKGEIKYINENFSKISKYNKAELTGSPHNIINSGLHSRDFFKNMWATIGKGNIWQGELRNRTKEGDYYWVYTTIVPIKEDGKIKEYFSVRVEITDQIEIEKARKLEQKRYRQLYDHIHDGVIVINKDFQILDINNAAIRMDKLNKKLLIGKDIRIAFKGLKSSGFLDLIQETYFKGFAHFPMLKYDDGENRFW